MTRGNVYTWNFLLACFSPSWHFRTQACMQTYRQKYVTYMSSLFFAWFRNSGCTYTYIYMCLHTQACIRNLQSAISQMKKKSVIHVHSESQPFYSFRRGQSPYILTITYRDSHNYQPWRYYTLP